VLSVAGTVAWPLANWLVNSFSMMQEIMCMWETTLITGLSGLCGVAVPVLVGCYLDKDLLLQ
jgi:hypothetical protein